MKGKIALNKRRRMLPSTGFEKEKNASNDWRRQAQNPSTSCSIHKHE
jgi:hypothetical protein